MAAAHDVWTVLPHGPLTALESNLWRVQGSLTNVPLQRVMTIARRRDGQLVIHNAIALEDGPMAEIESFGEPGFLVVPNAYHRLDARVFKDRYPKLRVVCPAGARKAVGAVVPVDFDYDDMPADPDVSLRHVAGTRNAEGVMIVRHGDGATLVFNDLVFNMPHRSGLTGFIFKHVTQSSGGPRVSRVGRLFLVKDRAAFDDDLRKLAETPGLRRIIVSHHETIDGDCPEVLRRIAASRTGVGRIDEAGSTRGDDRHP